jgi:hypothetical protein
MLRMQSIRFKLAGKAAKEAGEGGQAVKEAVEAMKSIAGKVGIIDDIAYQTNLPWPVFLIGLGDSAGCNHQVMAYVLSSLKWPP